jgi:hypothetical protein
MIISASRRTDIPAFYSDWLIERIKHGYACVKNPMNPKQVKNCIIKNKMLIVLFLTKKPTFNDKLKLRDLVICIIS